MKKRLRILLGLALLLALPCARMQAQCLSIYKSGLSQMNSGKYTEAIKSFEAAKECDSSLASDCDAQIKTCRSKLADYYYKSGTTSMNNGDYSRAASAFRTAKSYGATGCDTYIRQCETEMNKQYSISVERDTLFFECGGSVTQYINVNATNNDWKVRDGESWCMPLAMSGNTKLAVECTENSDNEARTTRLTLYNSHVNKEVVIVQEGLQPKINIADTIYIPYGETTLYVDVDANIDWNVELVGSDWLDVQKNSRLMLTLTLSKKDKNDRACKVLLTSADGSVSTMFVVQANGKPKKGGLLGLGLSL